MRSAVLRKLFRGIVAAVVPGASFVGCSVVECSGQEGQSTHFRVVDDYGHIIYDSLSPPVIPDGGTGSVASDAGTDAGADGGTPNCESSCGIFGCGGEYVRDCTVLAHISNQWVVRCDYDIHPVCMPKGTVCGRRPAGWTQARVEHRPSRGALAALLSQQAALEAASVPAFHALARELEAHGAPRALCLAAKRAAADEVRHARRMGDLARQRGGSVNPPRVRGRRVRSLARIAGDNRVEGGGRGTFGAMVAMWEGRAAKGHAARGAAQRAPGRGG